MIEGEKTLSCIECGVIETLPHTSQSERLKDIAENIRALLRRVMPDAVGVETLFFAKNRKTALSVAQARGVLLLKSLEATVPVVEYAPREIKLAVTGYGAADKIAVATMVKKFLRVEELKGHDDASDALAIAITAANYKKFK